MITKSWLELNHVAHTVNVMCDLYKRNSLFLNASNKIQLSFSSKSNEKMDTTHLRRGVVVGARVELTYPGPQRGEGP